MESKFVNKQNLSFLNSQLSRQLNLSDKSKSEKKEMLSMLLGNMRKVYNKLDKSKISDKHLPKILDTFNRYALNETIKDISSKTQVTRNSNTDNLKYNRDREISNNNNVHYLERPKQTHTKQSNSYDLTRRNFDAKKQNNGDIGDTQFDQSSRYTDNVAPEKAMEMLLKERSSQVREPNRPSTPDFLKSKRTSKTVESFSDNSSSNRSDNNTSNNLGMQGDTYYLSGANLDSNFSSIDFGNNEISQGLPDVDESIDTNKRLEMLQKERSTLGNNSTNTSDVPKPDFSKSIEENEKLLQQKQYDQQQPQQHQQQPQQHQQQPQQHQQQPQQYQQQPQQYQQQQQYQQPQQYQQQPQQYQQQPQNTRNSNNVLDKLQNLQQDDLLKLLNTYAQNSTHVPPPPREPVIEKREERREERSDMKSKHDKRGNQVSDYLSELTRKQVEQLKQVQALQEQLQSHIKNQMLNPNINTNNSQVQRVEHSSSNDQLKNELVSKVKILTGQLEQEKKINIELRNRLDEEIETRNNDNDKKLHLIEIKKEEIRNEVNNLSSKHKDIEKSYQVLLRKEKFLTKLIEKNKKMIQADKSTILVDSKVHNSQSKFIYVLDSKLTNVCKVELLSYDFPLTSNNINETNNKLYFKFDKELSDQSAKEISNNSSDSEEVAVDTNEDVNIVTIPAGNYDISTLIKKLNKLGRTYKIIFSYNKNTNKVTIKSENTFTLFKKENNILDLLGYEDEELENNNNYQGSKPYDLRKCSYVYINLLNVSDKTFATVNVNNTKKGSYYLDTDSIDLDRLEIEVKDEFGNLMNFCNLSFKLEFNFIFSNKNIAIEDKTSSENLIDSDNSSDNRTISSPDISSIVLNN